MAAELIQMHPHNPEPRKLARVVETLRQGGVVIYPTDTVYGMGCDIHQARAIERVAQAKGIRADKSDFSIICDDLSHIAAYARVSNAAFKLMKRLLPGPYTFLLPAGSRLPRTLNPRRRAIGIRNPQHAIPCGLVSGLGNPIITTSIKTDDDFLEYPADPGQIYELFKNKVEIVIDGGPGGLLPSTIIDATTDAFTLVRAGLGEWEGD